MAGKTIRGGVLVAGWAWLAAALVQVTDAAVAFDWWVVLFLSAPVVAVAWAVCSAASPGVFRERRRRWAWCSVPVGAALVALLATTDWGFVARVWLCERELRAYAEAIQQDERSERAGRVGLFHVYSADGEKSEARLLTSRGLMDGHGLAYRPSPPRDDDRRYTHLFGPWYRYWADYRF